MFYFNIYLFAYVPVNIEIVGCKFVLVGRDEPYLKTQFD